MRNIIDTTASPEAPTSRPESKNWIRRLWKPVGTTALAGLAVVGLVVGGKNAVEGIFSGDKVPTPMGVEYVFPPCVDHAPIVMEQTLPTGMVIQTGPHGADKMLTITILGPGKPKYSDNGIDRVPGQPGQNQDTDNYVFDKAGNERLSILAVPGDSSDPALRGQTRVIETQYC